MNEEELKKRLEMLRIEHRDLDAAIDALTAAGEEGCSSRLRRWGKRSRKRGTNGASSTRP